MLGKYKNKTKTEMINMDIKFWRGKVRNYLKSSPWTRFWYVKNGRQNISFASGNHTVTSKMYPRKELDIAIRAYYNAKDQDIYWYTPKRLY